MKILIVNYLIKKIGLFYPTQCRKRVNLKYEFKALQYALDSLLSFSPLEATLTIERINGFLSNQKTICPKALSQILQIVSFTFRVKVT